MIRFTRWIATAVVAAPLALTAPATADATVWRDVAGWDVSFHSNLDDCLAFTVYEEGTSFFIGLKSSTGRITSRSP